MLPSIKSNQVRMSYRSGTDGRYCIGADRRFVFNQSPGGSTLLREKDVMAAMFKEWSQLESFTPSIDAYFLEEHSCQISSWSVLKRRNLGLFLKRKRRTTTRTRWDQFLI